MFKMLNVNYPPATYNHKQSNTNRKRTVARHTSIPSKWNFKKLYILYLIS